MANRQVRLDPDVCAWVEEHAFDLDISLSAATNLLLREVRDGPADAPPSTPPVQAAVPAPRPPRVVARGGNPHLAELLRRNAGR